MAFTKSHLFDKKDQAISSVCKAFGHPARIEIIRFLKNQGPTAVTDLLRHLPLSKPSISQHLAILRRSAMVRYKEEYPYTIYSIQKSTLLKAKSLLNDLILTI